METSKDPCWLSFMPWVHFLSGQCVPFEPPEMEVKHDSETGKWWGITSVKTELGVFKSQYGKWAMYEHFFTLQVHQNRRKENYHSKFRRNIYYLRLENKFQRSTKLGNKFSSSKLPGLKLTHLA
jgi:hypothetical protein